MENVISEKHNIQPLTEEEIELIGEYEIDVKTYLQQFKTYQGDDGCASEVSENLGWFIHKYEQNIFKYMDLLGGEQYSGGNWGMEHGFFYLHDDTGIFIMRSGFGEESRLDALSFSAVVNLMVLSQMAIQAYEEKNFFDNQMAVFLSDHLKDLMEKNIEIFSTDDIYRIIN